jgi:hypothetical protein
MTFRPLIAKFSKCSAKRVRPRDPRRRKVTGERGVFLQAAASAPDRVREIRCVGSGAHPPLDGKHAGSADMLDRVSSRFVMFFFARCRDDFSWYMSIKPQTLEQAANDCRPRDETCYGRDALPQSSAPSTPASTSMASLMACTRPSIERSSMCSVIEMRRRAVPDGTVGGRMARTSKPID